MLTGAAIDCSSKALPEMGFGMFARMRSSIILILLVWPFFSACSGGSTAAPPPPPPPTTYTIGGTVINLSGMGGGMQLEDNGHDPLLVNANGTFTFPTALASGSAYNVTVAVQPFAPAQTCEVLHGTGVATSERHERNG